MRWYILLRVIKLALVSVEDAEVVDRKGDREINLNHVVLSSRHEQNKNTCLLWAVACLTLGLVLRAQ